MGQMVTVYYPMLANMSFTKVDTKFHDIVNKYWNELYLDEIMKAGIESELDIGNGSGDGLFKDIINVYLQIDNQYNAKKVNETITEFKELFDKYKISIKSFNRVYKMSLKKTNNENLKKAILDFIYDIDNLSINNEKVYLRDKETTIKPIEEDLKKLKQEKQKNKNKDVR